MIEPTEAAACWAEAIRQATGHLTAALDRPEWNYLADCLNGFLADPDSDRPGAWLSAEAYDAHRLNATGAKWFDADPEAAANAVADLCQKLDALDYVHAWAIILAVRFFWRHPTIDHLTAEWWTIAFQQQTEPPF